MSSEIYQGFKNHATWVVDLWLNNTQSAYKMLQRVANASNDIEQRAIELRDNVRRTYDRQRELSLDSRAELWGAGIREDLYYDEKLEDVNYIEIIERAQEA